MLPDRPVTQTTPTPPTDEIVHRILAVAHAEPGASEQDVNRLFATLKLPEAPTLRALLLASRYLQLPGSHDVVWGAGETPRRARHGGNP